MKWLGRRLVRTGLWLIGVEPAKLMFVAVDKSWTASDMAAWLRAAVDASPNRVPISVVVPLEMRGEWRLVSPVNAAGERIGPAREVRGG